MDGWSLPTLVLFPVPSLCVISPCHHSPGLFSQKTRASPSITKNPLITKGYQWWLLARCSFCPILIIHSAHVAGNMEDSVNGPLQKMLSNWWVSKPAIFYQISYQSIANSDLDWPHPQPYTPPPGHFFSHQRCPSLPHGPLTLCPLLLPPLPIVCFSVHTLTTLQMTQRLSLSTHKWILRSFHDWCRITAISRKYLLNKSCLIDKKLGSFEDKQNSQVTHWFVADLSFKTHNYLSQNCFSPPWYLTPSGRQTPSLASWSSSSAHPPTETHALDTFRKHSADNLFCSKCGTNWQTLFSKSHEQRTSLSSEMNLQWVSWWRPLLILAGRRGGVSPSNQWLASGGRRDAKCILVTHNGNWN